jgi:hypothetical protein
LSSRHEFSGWLALTADPAPLLGLPPVPRERDDALLHRRDASFAAVQEHYYPDPPRIEREWRHHLAAAASAALPTGFSAGNAARR